MLHHKNILQGDRKTGKSISQLEDESSCFLCSVLSAFNWWGGDDDKWTEVIHLLQLRFSLGQAHNRRLRLKGREAERVGDWGVCWEKRLSTLFCHFENTLLRTSVLRLHSFCTALQSFYENVPPGLHSLCITECLIWFLQPSIMNGQNGLVCCPHILPISLQLW